MIIVLTGDSVVVPAPDIHVVELDGEKVLFVPEPQTLHQLDQMASLLWDCLVPASPLDEIAGDLAEAFAVDHATVLHDIITAATVLVDAGALIPVGGNRST